MSYNPFHNISDYLVEILFFAKCVYKLSKAIENNLKKWQHTSSILVFQEHNFCLSIAESSRNVKNVLFYLFFFRLKA